MRFADLLQQDTATLELELRDKRAELEQLRFAVASGALKQVHKISAARREIARLQTALRAKRV